MHSYDNKQLGLFLYEKIKCMWKEKKIILSRAKKMN